MKSNKDKIMWRGQTINKEQAVNHIVKGLDCFLGKRGFERTGEERGVVSPYYEDTFKGHLRETYEHKTKDIKFTVNFFLKQKGFNKNPKILEDLISLSLYLNGEHTKTNQTVEITEIEPIKELTESEELLYYDFVCSNPTEDIPPALDKILKKGKTIVEDYSPYMHHIDEFFENPPFLYKYQEDPITSINSPRASLVKKGSTIFVEESPVVYGENKEKTGYDVAFEDLFFIIDKWETHRIVPTIGHILSVLIECIEEDVIIYKKH